ncbi:hypothetical protein RRG08_016496 [Elysia crispata]|uniref:Uncharacterized protein n=1 Tax=Elysia crispata TaxID=231223 RepID=A0AAE0Y9Z4_9GAST|nr:hypothetical protein RRG08_016496 [Elysia crispata]
MSVSWENRICAVYVTCTSNPSTKQLLLPPSCSGFPADLSDNRINQSIAVYYTEEGLVPVLSLVTFALLLPENGAGQRSSYRHLTTTIHRQTKHLTFRLTRGMAD